MRALTSRIKRLEKKRSKKQRRSSRVVEYSPATQTAAEALANVGKPGKYLCVPNFGSDDDWRRAAIRQQQALIGSNKKLPPKAAKHTTTECDMPLAPGMTQRRTLEQNDDKQGLKFIFKR